eukprot:Phypoly_transcript_16296.p3 GENE.Phypoly_transcript_16296~~Phypoly_transcript_16296.p3  ORF type:complete len:126 (+),score=33.71 Phypoly_transcript_16296:179-556(+)
MQKLVNRILGLLETSHPASARPKLPPLFSPQVSNATPPATTTSSLSSASSTPPISSAHAASAPSVSSTTTTPSTTSALSTSSALPLDRTQTSTEELTLAPTYGHTLLVVSAVIATAAILWILRKR